MWVLNLLRKDKKGIGSHCYRPLQSGGRGSKRHQIGVVKRLYIAGETTVKNNLGAHISLSN